MKRQRAIFNFSFHLRIAWLHRRFLLKSTATGLLLGLFLSLILPKEYEARMLTAAESTAIPDNDEALGELLAGGIAGETPARYDALRPSLYPQIFASVPFLDSLSRIFVQPVDGASDSIFTLREYLEQQHFRLSTPSADAFIDELRERISIVPDEKTRTVAVVCRMRDPLVAATVLDSLNRRIHAYITEYRTRRSRAELSAATKVLAQAKERLYSAQEAQAAFEDRNRDLFTGNARKEQTRLRVQTALAKEEYARAVLKEQAARAKVVRVRPVFAVIEPPTVPVRPASPSKLKYMLAFGLAGLAAGYVRVVWGMRRKEFTR